MRKRTLNKWTVNRINDFAEIVAGGTPSTSVDEYWNGDIGWITPADLSNYKRRYISRGERNISELGLKKSSACLLPKNTVLLSSRAPIGYVALAETELATNQGFKNLICDENKVDYRFIYYWLLLNSEVLKSFASGATFPEISASKVKKIKAILPDLPTQKRIANILSTYDDLIENNNRRIALLEKAAQELYKEWFVRFRFPGYETTKFENGFPKGWNVVKLGDYVEIKGGKRLPEGKSLCEEKTNHPYIRIRDISSSKFVSLNKNFEYIDDETFDIINRFTVNSGDILISIVGTIGAIACVSNNLDGANLTENCVKLVNVEHFTNDYLYHFFNSEMGKGVIQAGIVGATQPKLPLYNIKRIKLLKPYKELIDMYSDKIKIIDQQIMCLMDKNQNLTKQRDLLLPRLMSGKLEV